jgi:hypothetical protein
MAIVEAPRDGPSSPPLRKTKASSSKSTPWWTQKRASSDDRTVSGRTGAILSSDTQRRSTSFKAIARPIIGREIGGTTA